MIRAGIRRMKRLWAADSLQDCAHEILIVVKFGSTLSPRPLSAAYMSSSWCELFRGKMFPRFSPIFFIRFYFILAIWLSNNLSVRLTEDCFWMVFFFFIFCAPFAELSRFHFRPGMLTTKIVKPQDAGEPDEFEKTISQVCLEYFLRNKCSQNDWFRVRCFFFFLLGWSLVGPFCFFIRMVWMPD